jgi:hypothetical protein
MGQALRRSLAFEGAIDSDCHSGQVGHSTNTLAPPSSAYVVNGLRRVASGSSLWSDDGEDLDEEEEVMFYYCHVTHCCIWSQRVSLNILSEVFFSNEDNKHI